MAFTDRIVVAVDFVTTGAKKGVADLKMEVAQADGAFGKLKASGSGALTLLKQNAGLVGVALAGMAGVGLKKAVDAASDLEESINAVNVTFGDAADEVLAFTESAAMNLGLSQSAANDAAVAFAAFAKAAGGDTSDNIEMLMTRAADFASVMNLDVTEAVRIFQSALAGETEPIRKFGKDMSAVTVEAFALENGLAATKQEITENIKVQARFGLLMQQTEDVAGDFADTSGDLANAQRRLSAQTEDLAAKIGATVVPILADATSLAIELANALEGIGEAVRANTPNENEWSLFSGPRFIWEETKAAVDALATTYRDAWNIDTKPAEEATEALEGMSDQARQTVDALRAQREESEQVAAETAELDQQMRLAAASGDRWERRLQDLADTEKETRDETQRLSEAAEAHDAVLRAQTALERYPERLERVRERLYATSEAFGTAADGAKRSFDDLDVNAETSTQNLIDHLNTTAVEVGVWQNDLTSIAADTSPEFAGYLADMGAAGAPMVADLAADGEGLKTAFNAYTEYSSQMQRDVGAEFDKLPGKTDEAFASVKAKIDGNLAAALENARGTAGQFYDVGLAIPAGVERGIYAGRSGAISAAVSIATAALSAAKAALEIESPSKRTAREIGVPFAEGIAEGIGYGSGQIDEAVLEALDKALEKAEDRLDNALDQIQTVRDRADARQAIRDAKRDVTDARSGLKEARQAKAATGADYDAKLSMLEGMGLKGSAEYRAVQAAKRAAMAEARGEVSDARQDVKAAREDVSDSYYGLWRELTSMSAAYIVKHKTEIRDIGKAAGISGKRITAVIQAAQAVVNARGSKQVARQDGGGGVGRAGHVIVETRQGLGFTDAQLRRLAREIRRVDREAA